MGKLTHVAVFSWKPGTTQAQLDAMADGLATLPGLIPEIRAYRFGPDAGLSPGSADFVVMADFDDEAGYRTYASDPRHLEVIERLVKPLVETRHALQFRSA
jgi:hypothetical protein